MSWTTIFVCWVFFKLGELTVETWWLWRERRERNTKVAKVNLEEVQHFNSYLRARGMPSVRPCEVCRGPGPCLWSDDGKNVHRYTCRQCWTGKEDHGFFARNSR